MFAFRDLVWSPDSKQLAVLLEHPTGSNIYLRGVQIFSVDERDSEGFDVFVEVNIFETDQQVKLAWSSNSSMLAVALPDEMQIHELQGDGTPLVSLSAYEIVDLKWSLDNRFIAAGSEDGTIRLWGVTSGE